MKIGRNEPCPCNSGKKYKKCCLNLGTRDLTTDENVISAYQMYEEYTASCSETACKKGCSYCCSQYVSAFDCEIDLLAHHIEKHRPDLIPKIIETDKRTRGMSESARLDEGIACPLLGDDGCCTVYEIRPLSCRQFTSPNVQDCIDKSETCMLDSRRIQAANKIKMVMFSSWGDGHEYELNRGLAKHFSPFIEAE